MEVKQERNFFNELNYVINQSEFCVKEDIDVNYRKVESNAERSEEEDIFIPTIEIKQERDTFNELSHVINQSIFCIKEEGDIKYKVESDVEPSDQEAAILCTSYDVINSRQLDQTQYKKLYQKYEHSESDKKHECEKYGNSYLDSHANAAHNEVKEYQSSLYSKIFSCNICSKTFSQKDYVTIHMRVHTGERPYSCNLCTKRFSQKGSLNIHMRQHTGVKPYSCNICSNTFNLKESLKRHMSAHTGKRPHSCHICSKSFHVSGRLIQHMMVHIEPRLYTCNTCSRTFSKSGSLATHMRVHRSDRYYSCNIRSETVNV